MPAEHGGDHLLGRGLAVAAGDGDHQRLDAPQRVRGERVESLPGIGHDHLDDARRDGRPVIDHDRCRAPRDRVAHELVAVFVRAAQREEQAALPHLARVGVKRGERLADLGAADLATARRLEDLEEAQPHWLSRTFSGGLVLCAS